MDSTIENALDLRSVDFERAKAQLTERALATSKQSSFWALFDYDPVDFVETFEELGLIAQTFMYPQEGYRVFLGRCS
ncbi:MAG: hypothetical protein AAGB46_01260 [Verrucomicrobiota bacterium]